MHVNVTIIGLDRLGASFGLALKRYESQPNAQHSFTIIGSDNDSEPMKTAKKLGAVDNFHRDKIKAAENADLIIANLPYSQTEGLYARIGDVLKPGAVVLDTSLLKLAALGWADEFFAKSEQGKPLAYLVGIMPIVNVKALYSGANEAADAREDLFDNAEVIVAPDARCPAEAVQLAEDIVRLLGARPRFMDPAEHDGLIAATEGLPALLGATLFYTLAQSEGWLELRRMVNPTLALTIQSLRDNSEADLMGMFSQNRENLLRHVDNLLARLGEVREALAAGGDDAELEAFVSMVARAWNTWDAKRYSGSWDETAKGPEVMAGPFGTVGGFIFGRRTKKSDDEDDA